MKCTYNDLSAQEAIVLNKVLTDLRSRKRIKSENLVFQSDCNSIYFDVDGTLILYKDTKNSMIITDHHGLDIPVLPHKKHIQRLINHKKAGLEVILWSAAGASWCKLVAKALKISKYVDAYHSKPNYYYDDLNSSEWIGKRVYLKP